jgi:PAS domain S-box-containing protein
MFKFISNLHTIRNQYVLFLTTIVITILSSQLLIQYDLNKQNEDAHLINIAGRQRTLGQRIAKLALYIDNEFSQQGNVSAARLDTMKVLVDTWETVQNSLRQGNAHFGLSDRRSPAIDSLLSKTTIHLVPIVNVCRELTASPSKSTSKNAIEVIALHELPFLWAMENTVKTYQYEAEEKLNQMKYIEIALSLSALVILLLEFLYLFRPMVRRVEQSNKQLSEINNDLISTNEELRASEEELKTNLEFITTLQAEVSMRERQYREVIESATDMIYELDDAGNFSFVNPVMEKVIGFSRHEFRNKKYWEIVQPDYVEKTKEFYKQQRSKKIDQTYYELPVITKSSELIWVGQNVKMFFDGTLVTKVSVIARDITRLKEVNDKLVESEKRYRLISTNSKDLITIYTAEADPKRVFVSPSVKEILGYEPEELIGKSPFELILPEDAEKMKNNTHAITLSGKSATGEYRIKRKDGRIIWLQSNSNPFSDENGKMIGFQTSARDITEQKIAELALQKSEQRFRILADNAPIGIFQTDITGDYVYVNKRWCEIAGMNEKDALIAGWANAIVYEDRQAVFEKWSEALKNQTEFNTEFRVAGRSMAPRLVHTQATQVKLDGELIGFIGTVSDVTDLREAQKKLAESEKLYRELLENALDVTWLIDTSGHVVYTSSSVASVLGYTSDELAGRSVYSLLQESERPIFDTAFKDSMAGSTLRHVEFRLQKKNGDWVWIDTTTQPVTGPNGKISSVQLTTRDITLKKEAEAALKVAKQKAEEATHAKSQFLSMMSHEIRTPMNAIIGLTHLLLQDKPRPDQIDSLNLLRFSGENLLTIINDILDFNKIEENKITLESIDVDLQGLLANLTQMLRQRADAKDIGLEFFYDPSLPRIFKFDPVRVGQIVTNLMGNAIKFTHHGSVKLSVTSSGKTDSGYCIAFHIQDTGIGIPADKLDSIFERFSQANEDTTRKFGGTGLGLSISRRLLLLMNSDIKVKSTLNVGSQFSFELSLSSGSEQLVKSTSSSQGYGHLGIKVLLVEDNRVNQVVAMNFLKRWGVEVVIANHGKEALEKIVTKDYSIVLMDLQMPEMDGYEASRRIRAMNDSYFTTVPILALTASAMMDVKGKVLAAGMSDFISKPFQPHELFEKIAGFVAMKKNEDLDGDIKANLHAYSEGDADFKKELATNVIRNILELKTALHESIADRSDRTRFSKACHKVKTSLSLVGDKNFIAVVKRINDDLTHGVLPKKRDVTDFEDASKKIIEELETEIALSGNSFNA